MLGVSPVCQSLPWAICQIQKVHARNNNWMETTLMPNYRFLASEKRRCQVMNRSLKIFRRRIPNSKSSVKVCANTMSNRTIVLNASKITSRLGSCEKLMMTWTTICEYLNRSWFAQRNACLDVDKSFRKFYCQSFKHSLERPPTTPLHLGPAAVLHL